MSRRLVLVWACRLCRSLFDTPQSSGWGVFLLVLPTLTLEYI